MADLSHYERTANARTSYASRDERSDQVRQRSSILIGRVLRATAGKPEIEIHLALGAACPFGLQSDRNIWVEEIHRLRGEA